MFLAFCKYVSVYFFVDSKRIELKKKERKISFGYFIQSCRCISAQLHMLQDGQMKTMNENNLSKKKGEKKLQCEIVHKQNLHVKRTSLPIVELT